MTPKAPKEAQKEEKVQNEVSLSNITLKKQVMKSVCQEVDANRVNPEKLSELEITAFTGLRFKTIIYYPHIQSYTIFFII